MVQVRASQVFTHSIEDAVAAKKALDAETPFTEVVEKYSTCPSKQQGGDLGWMPEEAALSLMGEKITPNEPKLLRLRLSYWPRYNNYAVPNITFKHTKGSGKGNNIIKMRYYLSVQTSMVDKLDLKLTKFDEMLHDNHEMFSTFS